LLHHHRKARGQRATGRQRNGNRTGRDCNQSTARHRDCKRASCNRRSDDASHYSTRHDGFRNSHCEATPTRPRRSQAHDVGVRRPSDIGKTMSTAQEIMATVGERLAANKAAASEIGAIYKFVLEGEGGGTWIMNLKGDATLTPGDGASDCTLAMSAENGVALFEGKVTGEQLFFSNQLRVEGDMSLALRLQSLLAIVR